MINLKERLWVSKNMRNVHYVERAFMICNELQLTLIVKVATQTFSHLSGRIGYEQHTPRQICALQR